MHSRIAYPILRVWIAAACGLLPSVARAEIPAAEEAEAQATLPIRKLPLQGLRAVAALVAGERLSAYWAEGDTLRPMVHAKTATGTWRLIRKPDPTANGRLRGDWRLLADLAGPVDFRFSDPFSGKAFDSLRIMVAAPAGSPAMGPVLDSALEAANRDEQAASNFIPYRSASDLADLQARLASAEGGAKCLPNAAGLRETVRKDARAFAGGLPILVSRVKYHFRDPRSWALNADEFRAVGFPESAIASQRVLFMLDDAYLLANVADPVVRVEIRIGQDTVIVRRNAQREYVFASDGMQTVFLRAVTAKGESWEQATVLEVPAAVEAQAPERAEAPGSGADLAVGKPEIQVGNPPARD